MKHFSYTLIFLLYCTAIYYITDSQHNDHFGPRSMHAWRQADGASYARNYYQNNLPFLMPQVYTQAGTNGYTVSEFPIVYYIAAKMYRAFGFHESILRRLHFAIFIFGCASLLWLGLLLFKNSWLAFIPAVITFSSPYLYYYGLNFMPDVPALSLSFGGIYFIAAYFFDKKLWKMYFAFALFCLACLLKISNGILFCALIAAVVFSPKLRTEKYFRTKHLIHFFLLAFLVIAINGWWFYFVTTYNNTYGNHLNLTSIYPIWELTWQGFDKICVAFYDEWSTVILHPVVWNILFVGIWLFATRKLRIENSMLHKVVLWIFFGSLTYGLLWFQAFWPHDYYLVPPFISVLGIFIWLLYFIDEHYDQVKRLVIPIAIIIVFDTTVQAQGVMNSRYAKNQKYTIINEGFYTIETYLRSLGISRFDWVVSVPDGSPNITLYYLNQPGYTESGNWFINNCGRLKEANIKYAVVSDDRFLQNQQFVSQLDGQIGEYKGIKIFKVKK